MGILHDALEEKTKSDNENKYSDEALKFTDLEKHNIVVDSLKVNNDNVLKLYVESGYLVINQDLLNFLKYVLDNGTKNTADTLNIEQEEVLQ